MKLSRADKLAIFNSIENGFDSVIELLCKKKGGIIDYSESFSLIYPEIKQKKLSIFSLIEEESIGAIEMLLTPPASAVVHFSAQGGIIETFSCRSAIVTDGVYIYGVRVKSTYGSSIDDITRERNILHQKLLESMSEHEITFIALKENCDKINYFFQRITDSFSFLQELTNREFEIFILLHKQQSSVKIAEYLNISESTVEKHLLSIKDKTGSENFSAASELSQKFANIAVEDGFEIGKIKEIVEQSTKLIQTAIINKNKNIPGARLTDREREIINLIIQHKSNKEISEILFLSENTVKSHITRIFKKLNIHSRKELTQSQEY